MLICERCGLICAYSWPASFCSAGSRVTSSICSVARRYIICPVADRVCLLFRFMVEF